MRHFVKQSRSGRPCLVRQGNRAVREKNNKGLGENQNGQGLENSPTNALIEGISRRLFPTRLHQQMVITQE